MKKIFLWASISALTIGLLIAAIFTGGCSKNDTEQPSTDELLGTWVNQSFGEDGEEFINTTIEIKKDGTMKITYSPDEDGIADSAEMRWSVKGNIFIFSFIDENEDGTPDTEEEFPSEEVEYMIQGNTLIFSYNEDVDPWEFTKQ